MHHIPGCNSITVQLHNDQCEANSNLISWDPISDLSCKHRKNAEQVLPMERVFSVPNTDGFIEEGKKVAKQTRPIVIRGLANFNIRIPVETYTSSGWPAVGGAAIKVGECPIYSLSERQCS